MLQLTRLFRWGRYCLQSSHLRPNLLIVYFVYVRTSTIRVVTVSVTDTVSVASQNREYGSTKLGVIPGGGGRPGRSARETSCPGGEAMKLQYQSEVSACPLSSARVLHDAISSNRIVEEWIVGSSRW